MDVPPPVPNENRRQTVGNLQGPSFLLELAWPLVLPAVGNLQGPAFLLEVAGPLVPLVGNHLKEKPSAAEAQNPQTEA